jgi:hypothetical protein
MDLVEGESAQCLPQDLKVRCITYGAPPGISLENNNCTNNISVLGSQSSNLTEYSENLNTT